MRKIYTLLFALALSVLSFGQTEKIVIVEHFTNTKCSICASRNPAFYNLLDNYPDVLHIAYHPSSPYSSCVFSQHNPEENDARTNYYGIYGGTPRVVVQGDVIAPGSQLLTADQLESKLGMMTNYSMTIKHQHGSADNIEIAATIKRLNGSGSESLMFYGALAEETVDYMAPNGEDMHSDVFRKFVIQEQVNLTNEGDSVILTATYTTDVAWVLDEIYVIGMLQHPTDKSILQAARSGPAEAMSAINTEKIQEIDQLFYPNPARDYIIIQPEFRSQLKEAELYNLFGKKVMDIHLNSQTDISHLPKGYYFLVAMSASGQPITTRLLKQ